MEGRESAAGPAAETVVIAGKLMSIGRPSWREEVYQINYGAELDPVVRGPEPGPGGLEAGPGGWPGQGAATTRPNMRTAIRLTAVILLTIAYNVGSK